MHLQQAIHGPKILPLYTGGYLRFHQNVQVHLSQKCWLQKIKPAAGWVIMGGSVGCEEPSFQYWWRMSIHDESVRQIYKKMCWKDDVKSDKVWMGHDRFKRLWRVWNYKIGNDISWSPKMQPRSVPGPEGNHFVAMAKEAELRTSGFPDPSWKFKEIQPAEAKHMCLTQLGALWICRVTR